MVMRGNAYPWMHANTNIVSQGFIQDFSKGGGELKDVHPQSVLSDEDSHRRPKPIEESLEKKK